MTERETAITLLNRTDFGEVWRLENDPRMRELGLASGVLAYTRAPRCEVRRRLQEEVLSSPDDADYWANLASLVKVYHGPYCPNGICLDDPYTRSEVAQAFQAHA